MAFILCVGTPKGGSGKTTLSILLGLAYAEMGYAVTIFDTDPQGSVLQWFSKASGDERPDLKVVSADDANFLELLAQNDDQDVIVIDLPGVMSRVMGIAIGRADILLVPARASELDLQEVVKFLEYVHAVFGHVRPILARCVFNDVGGIDPTTRAFGAALDFARANKIPLLRMMLRSRPIYKALAAGAARLSGTGADLAQVAKARENVELLATEILAVAGAVEGATP